MKTPPLPPSSRPEDKTHFEEKGFRSFSIMIQNGAERAFRLVSYFIWTCLVFGLTAVVCPSGLLEALVLDLLVAILALFFWLYVASLTAAPLLNFLVLKVLKLQFSRKVYWATNAGIVAFAVFIGFMLPVNTIIDAYVLQLFPSAGTCSYYFQ